MPNFALLACGQQAATTAATALPQTVPSPPIGGGGVRGEGFQVILENLKASTASLFYGGPNVAASGNNAGKEIAPGNQDTFKVNDTSQIYVIAAGNNTATASWSVTNT
jgi:hypothetical protein